MRKAGSALTVKEGGKLMYDELVKRLRCLKYGSCPDCPMWYSEEVEPNLWRERCAAIDAADAIEELVRKERRASDGEM